MYRARAQSQSQEKICDAIAVFLSIELDSEFIKARLFSKKLQSAIQRFEFVLE